MRWHDLCRFIRQYSVTYSINQTNTEGYPQEKFIYNSNLANLCYI